MLPIVAYLIAGFFLLVALLLWRRSVGMGMDRDQLARAQAISVEREKELMSEITRLRGKLEEARAIRDRLKLESDGYRERLAGLESELHRLKDDLGTSESNHQRARENDRQQLAAMTEQLRSLHRSEAEARRQLRQFEERFEQAISQRLEEQADDRVRLERAVQEAQAEVARKEAEIRKRNELLRKVNPRKVEALRRKLNNMNHLLLSMRGAKEIAEEQNHNWELALRALSLWVLSRKGQEPATDRSVARLVADAVDAIEVSLEPEYDLHTGPSCEGGANQPQF